MEQKTLLSRNEILDNILGLLLSFESLTFKEIFKVTNPVKIDMEFIAKTLNQYQWKDWMKESFKDELLFNGYIREDESANILITEEGREFKNNGGYQAQELKHVWTKDLYPQIEKINRTYNQKLTLVGILIFIVQVITITIIKL
ncbi:hypothetical protein [Mangrovimonas sp. DI 80]|uniref:hypothetical protein n=1 Tax=Mangrovimonas sp. DI 80 TaxID=1779330 RepID=UPI0009774F79|nr:hypothetical protein [Mangrovimonas sp. DI 80]OMP30053.1 hypothetical protein BKM32_14335 [Mangrovimonas sp. DI 80]